MPARKHNGSRRKRRLLEEQARRVERLMQQHPANTSHDLQDARMVAQAMRELQARGMKA